MYDLFYDTIAAVATPPGDGGIGIIRISGRSAVELAEAIFRTASGIPAQGLPTHTLHYGCIHDPITGECVDDGILSIYRSPGSYTGEDSVEISCHGGMMPTRRVLEAALRSGARLAEPGEFTRRAFLNGRLDLAQAEAVPDIIRARTDEAMRVARRQLDGVLSADIRALRGKLIGIMAHIEAFIDFPEDVVELDPMQVEGLLLDTVARVDALLSTADHGRIYRDGVRTVITGRPNVGKSSLLNALLRESRAIVTPIPGTTRDTIEESLNVRGIPVRAVDTAGVRDTDDLVEKMGVDRARDSVETADVVLAVLDAGAGFTPEDEEMLLSIGMRKAIVVLNKSDLLRESEAAGLAASIQGWLRSRVNAEIPVINTAAPSNEGIEELEKALADAMLSGAAPTPDGVMVSNLRHKQALEEARSSLSQAAATAGAKLSPDLVCIDLRAAADSLGRITGETVEEDVIDRIFGDFCIGK